MLKRLPPVEACLNCGSEVNTAFCPHCGQEAVQHTASAWELLCELIGGVFNLESKLFRALRLLLFKPGALTVAYNAGQRVRYVTPMRLYLTCSILFFLLVAWKQSAFVPPSAPKVAAPKASDQAMAEAAVGNVAKSIPIPVETGTAPSSTSAGSGPVPGKLPKSVHITANGKQMDTLDHLPDDPNAYISKLVKPGEKVSPFTPYIIKQVIKLKKVGQDGIIAKFLSNLPNMMFFLLPVFAIALKMLYIRSKAMYVEHLVFLLHAHAFAYIVLGLLMLLPNNPWSDWAMWVLPLYVFLAMRTVYRQPWWKTTLKFGMLSVGYFVIFFLCLVGTFIVTFLTI